MDPISNVDQLVLLLRQRLTERSRGASGEKRAAPEPPAPSVDTLRALAAIDGVDERQLRRALVQNILADHFGHGLINDAGFQQVVDRVAETLEGESGAARLLQRVVGELKAAVR
ncbi:MAG TPA: hypothetical protein VGI95_22060 [Caulobacteraceae bacterium]|jgi:hypothetical protein